MSDRFVVWDFDDVPSAYVPDDLLNMDNPLRLRTGESLAQDMPTGLQFTADSDYAQDSLLLDSFGNTESVIPVSPRLKEFLEGKGLAGLEFLPVELLDHGGKTVGHYFLLHCVNVIDAIDKTETEFEIDDLNEDMYECVENLTLLDGAVPDDTHIFRVKHLYSTVCVSRALARELDDKGFTGIYWEELSG